MSDVRRTSSTIRIAATDEQIARCHSVMAELRPYLDASQFLNQVKRQMRDAGYKLAFLEENGVILAVAGYRVAEMLAWGKAMYVDDLVTTSQRRATGCGSRLFDWLIEHARQGECDQFHLDSGVQRFGAHRFYLHKGMDINCHHFALTLSPRSD